MQSPYYRKDDYAKLKISSLAILNKKGTIRKKGGGGLF